MDLELKGRRALVSGSTAGIGFAIASALAKEGARVIVNGRTRAAVDDAVAQIRSATGMDANGFAGDLGLASAADEVARTHPNVEILVNNLGIFEPKPFEDIPDADWMRFFEVNVLSSVRLARLYLPAMRKADWGRIIFISSESAVQIPSEMIHYGMTKTAQLAVSRGLAEAVAGTGITVELRAARPDAVARRGRIRRNARPDRRRHVRSVREGILRQDATELAHQALRFARRSRQSGGLSRESARLGDDRRRGPGRRRGHPERDLRAFALPRI